MSYDKVVLLVVRNNSVIGNFLWKVDRQKLFTKNLSWGVGLLLCQVGGDFVAWCLVIPRPIRNRVR